MKKFLIFAGIVGMLASCSSDETVSDPSTKQDVLSFSGYVGNMTRSIGVLSQISDVEKMDVWCDINENGTAKTRSTASLRLRVRARAIRLRSLTIGSMTLAPARPCRS